jgi:hypothetical protein
MRFEGGNNVPEQINVISQNPPGGRCTLYARHIEELSSRTMIRLSIGLEDTADLEQALG